MSDLTVQYSIFIKSPLHGSSNLIYKMEQRKKKEKKTNLQNQFLIINGKIGQFSK